MKLIIHSLARTGSNSLFKYLNCHSDINLINEPFNPDLHRRDAIIASLSHAQNIIERLSSQYNGIKHVSDPEGWPFDVDSSLNIQLLSLFDFSIILKRKNSLMRLISRELSYQTNVWHVTNGNENELIRKFTYKPISIDMLEHEISMEEKFYTTLTDQLNIQNHRYKVLYYEDIFEDTDATKKLQLVNDALQFFKIRPFNPTEEQMILSLTSDSFAKVNDAGVYRRIPNINDIIKAFKSRFELYL
jgi:hypothetical protein